MGPQRAIVAARTVPLGRRTMRLPSASKMQREMGKSMPGANKHEQSVSKATQAANHDFFARGGTPLFPGE
jgi:hypothetical protein